MKTPLLSKSDNSGIRTHALRIRPERTALDHSAMLSLVFKAQNFGLVKNSRILNSQSIVSLLPEIFHSVERFLNRCIQTHVKLFYQRQKFVLLIHVGNCVRSART